VPRPPVPKAKRDAIIADFATEKARNQIARDHGVGVATVTKIAKEVGHQFDRSATKDATRAAVLDGKARRTLMSHRLLDRAEMALDNMDGPHLVFNFGGSSNTYREHLLDVPPTADQRNLMTMAAIAIDKHLAIDRHDADLGTEGARSVLGALGEALMVAADRIDGEITEP
jgi:hypothetical protein